MDAVFAITPLVVSTGSMVVIAHRYTKRVSALWGCVIVLSWSVTQAAGAVGLWLAFDPHTSALIAVLALLWVVTFALLLTRHYHYSMGFSVVILAAHAFAASHALHTLEEYPFVPALLHVVAALWAVTTACFSFSLSLLSAKAAAAMRTRQKDAATPGQPAPSRPMMEQAVRRGANIFMGHMRARAAKNEAAPIKGATNV